MGGRLARSARAVHKGIVVLEPCVVVRKITMSSAALDQVAKV